MNTTSPSTSAQDTASIPKGRIGRFILEREIGKGSVGTVYQFHDPLIGRKVAIKILNPQLPADQRSIFEKHFIQEARAAGRLNHPNIVTVYDADKSDDMLFIAMEYLEGKELRDIINSGHRFNYRQIADMIARVANALDYAHKQGVIHRDIKPANIFIVGKYTPKVLDFGIARASRQTADPEASLGFATITERRILGTPSYMSPEQTRAEQVDARTDIFSLGVVLYQLLCGELPFKGDTLQDLLENIEYESPIPPQDIQSDVPIRLAYIAGKALAKKPEDRYATAADMANDLNRYIAKERTNQIIATLRNPELAKPPVTEETPAAKSAATEREKDPNRVPLFASAVVLAVVVAVSALAWVTHKIGSRPSSTPPVMQMASSAAAIKNNPQPEVIPSIPAMPEHPNEIAAMPQAAPEPTPNQPIVKAAEPVTKQAAKPLTKTRQKSKAASKKAIASSGSGMVQIAVAPWGEVIVDGKSKGVAPPLAHLNLPVGAHSIDIRNGDDHYTVNIKVTTDNETRIMHQF